MAKQKNRVSIKCPQCDHPIVTLPEGYDLEEGLICPGCGARVEPQGPLEALLERTEETIAKLIGKNRR